MLSKEEELDRLFQLSPAMLCIAGIDGHFKRVNPAFERTLGYETQEFLVRPILDFVLPEDWEKTQEEIRKLSHGIPTIHFENRYRCKDGSRRWLSWLAAPHAIDGLIYAAAMDVTARKQSEEALRKSERRFRCLLESAPDVMVIVDCGGRLVLVNAQAESAFGYSRQELIGQNLEILIPERFRHRHRQHFADYALDPSVRPMGARPDLAARRRDGSELLCEISLSPIETDEGMLIAANVRDVTERRRHESLSRENEIQLLAAQRVQEHLLPDRPPVVPGFDLAGASYPAVFAGGDYFDYLSMPSGAIGLVIGDVSGHGLAPAMLMASTQAFLRTLVRSCAGIGQILSQANQLIRHVLEEDRFVTLLLAKLDPDTRSLHYVNAGHPAGYVMDRSGEVKASFPAMSPPIGVLDEMEFPEGQPVVLDRGDLVLLLTDGVLEAKSPDHKVFGSARALDVVRAHRFEPAHAILDALHHGVVDFLQGQRREDDITAMVIKADDTRR